MEDEDEEDDNEYIYFIGPCTCDHAMRDHSWGLCDQDGCECEAGWER